MDDRVFRKAMGCFASGVTVVTARDAEGKPLGVTVSAFSSVSLDPPLVLVCLDKRTRQLDAYAQGPFAVSVLNESQREVSIQFASKVEDKWKGIAQSAGGALGLPLIDGALMHVECTVQTVHESGDHLILIGRVQGLDAQIAGQPLLYFRGAYAALAEIM